MILVILTAVSEISKELSRALLSWLFSTFYFSYNGKILLSEGCDRLVVNKVINPLNVVDDVLEGRYRVLLGGWLVALAHPPFRFLNQFLDHLPGGRVEPEIRISLTPNPDKFGVALINFCFLFRHLLNVSSYKSPVQRTST